MGRDVGKLFLLSFSPQALEHSSWGLPWGPEENAQSLLWFLVFEWNKMKPEGVQAHNGWGRLVYVALLFCLASLFALIFIKIKR